MVIVFPHCNYNKWYQSEELRSRGADETGRDGAADLLLELQVFFFFFQVSTGREGALINR
jgi:hypothetical protein